MTDLATLGLEIRSDGVVVAKDRLRDFEGQANRTSKATDMLLKAFGALAAVFSVSKLIQYTNTWTDLNSRIEIATGSIGRGAATMDRLDQMARRTYSSLELTAESFLRNAGAMRELGYSTDQTLDYVESINNALVVSGTKGDRAESVMNALGKAMAIGKLSGDNLNTVLESGGRVAQALADSMGVSTLELRALGAAGKITGADIYGITSQMEQLREEADSMPATIGDAFQLIGNSVLSFVGRVDQAVGASSSISEALIGIADAIKGAIEPSIQIAGILAENLERLVFWAGSFATLMGVQYVAAVGAGALATAAFSAALVGLRIAIAGTGIGVLAIILGDVALRIYDAATATDELRDGLEEVKKPAGDLFAFLKNGADAIGATFDMLTAGIAAGFVGAFATIYTNYAILVNLIADGMNIVGISNTARMDPTWATGVYNELSDRATEAGNRAALSWAKAFGERVPELFDVDGVFAGLDTKTFGSADEMWGSLRGGGDNDNDKKTPGSASGKADAYATLTKSILENVEALKVEAETLGMTEYQATKLTIAQELLRAAAEAKKPITSELTAEINALAEKYAEAELTVAGLQMTMENRSPWEVMGEEITRLNELMDKGRISASTYWAEVGKSAERTASIYASAANGILGQASKLTEGLAGESEAAFNIQKAISIANAIVAGGEAVVKSYNWGSTFGGPVGGAIAAGLAAAATAAQIGAIASTSYTSKSAVSAGSGSGSVPSIPNAPQRQQAAPPPQVHEIVFKGTDKGMSQAELEAFVERMEEMSMGNDRQFRFRIAS
jgi:tape measure domain-containing protein